MVRNVRSEQQLFNLHREVLTIDVVSSAAAQHQVTYVLYILCQASANMLIERRPNLGSRDMLKGRKDRVLNLCLDSHLHDARGVPRELRRDQLENLFLPVNVLCLLLCPSLIEPLF